MKNQANHKKITLVQAVAHLKEYEGYHPIAYVIVKYRTEDVRGYKGSIVYGEVDHVESAEPNNGDTNYFHLATDSVIVPDYRIIEFILIELTESQLIYREKYHNMLSGLRFNFTVKSA